MKRAILLIILSATMLSACAQHYIRKIGAQTADTSSLYIYSEKTDVQTEIGFVTGIDTAFIRYITDKDTTQVGDTTYTHNYNAGGTHVPYNGHLTVELHYSHGDVRSNFSIGDTISLNPNLSDELFTTVVALYLETNEDEDNVTVIETAETNTTLLPSYLSRVTITQDIIAISESFSMNKTVLVNNLVLTTGTIADNDTSPDVTGASVWTYNGTANSVTITDLDNPVIGQAYTIIGNSDTYTISITDGGNFNISSNWTGGIDDVITIYVIADNRYIEFGDRIDN